MILRMTKDLFPFRLLAASKVLQEEIHRVEYYSTGQGYGQGGSHYFDFGDVNGDGMIDFAMGAKGKPFENGKLFCGLLFQ